MTDKRYKYVGANLECSNGKEYMLVKRDDGFNVCQVCSKYTAKEIVDELNNLADENEELRKENEQLKTQLQNTSDQRDEFHRGVRENANRVGKLEKENKQLKYSIKCLEADKMELQQYIKRMQGDVE